MIRKWGTTPQFKCRVLLTFQEMKESFEIRRVQAYSGERSLTIVLPKIYSEKLRIEKGDFLKVYVEDGKLVLQKSGL